MWLKISPEEFNLSDAEDAKSECSALLISEFLIGLDSEPALLLNPTTLHS
jgi:hypothetical protein